MRQNLFKTLVVLVLQSTNVVEEKENKDLVIIGLLKINLNTLRKTKYWQLPDIMTKVFLLNLTLQLQKLQMH